jgi:alkanesulfonate monooxygenase SsuD/methylene tetrahydromethanopterin reductase-like flavin-dependent oxidoreductase (luciferase family)
MEIEICVASHIGDIDYTIRAETLGYSSLWFADSQMLWSDCYATLALAADRTSRIRVGAGVAVTGSRPAPVTAASIATINAIAPGRTFLGVGAGNTAMRTMGRKPHRIADFDRYLSELRPLLRGEEADVRLGDDTKPIRHLMPDAGFVNFDDPIPLYVSGFGPRSLGLAGRHGDGAILGWPPSTAILARFLGWLDEGAREAGRPRNLVGTPEQIAERLLAYDAAGLDEVMILPALAPRYDVIERVARDVLPALSGS